MQKQQSGFTLIEMLITLVIASILIGISVPSFRVLMHNHRAVTLSSSFVSALNFARSEAIKRSEPVSMCAASDATLTSCGVAADWVNGWIVFADPNADGVIAATTDRLQVHQALPRGSLVTTTATRITYNAIGYADTGAVVFNLAAAECSGNHGRQVALTNTGRVDVTATTC